MNIVSGAEVGVSRREVLATGLTAAAVAFVPAVASTQPAANSPPPTNQGVMTMSTITTNDGTEIYFKDWGPKNAQPIVFHHGWPLSSDDWDAQMLYFLNQGYRVVAH